MAETKARTPEGMYLFEVYEESGNLLYVASFVVREDLAPTDRVFRRPWSTASEPEQIRGAS